MPRPLFTDGFNSVAHVALGGLFGARFVIPFLFYQYVLKVDENSTVDSLEYVVGWLLGEALKKHAGLHTKP